MKRATWFCIGGVILLLALAAFVGGRLWRDQAAPVSASDGPKVIMSGPGGTRQLDIVPAPERPPTQADVRGLFLRRQDNTLTVATGQFQVNLANGQVSTSHDGPEVEVVVSHTTQVYRDVTRFHEIGPQDTEVQQELVSGSIDEITDQAIISAWGEKRGDRFFAAVLVFKIVGD